MIQNLTLDNTSISKRIYTEADTKQMQFRIHQFHLACRIPFSIFRNGEILYRMTLSPDYNLPMICLNSLPKTLPPVWTCHMKEGVYFAGLKLDDHDCLLMLGPVITYDCTQERARKIMNHMHIRPHNLQDIRQYFSVHQQRESGTIFAALSFLDSYLNGHDSITPQPLEPHWTRIIDDSPISTSEITEEVSSNIESQLLSFIRKGEPDRIESFLTYSMPKQDILFIKHASSATEKMKTRIDVNNSIVLASHVAYESGVDYGLILQIRDDFENEVLTVPLEELGSIMYSYLIRLATLVKKCNQIPTQHPYVKKVVSYVQKHLYDPITVASISKELNCTSSYLCSVFKKDTGITISNYVHLMKIQEAEELLKTRQNKTNEISDMLGYSSPSYFCYIYKKFRKKAFQE